MKRILAAPNGRCWCGCGEGTRTFFHQGHDARAEKYLIGNLLQQLGFTVPTDPIAYHQSGARKHDGLANLLASLGFDSTPQGNVQVARRRNSRK